LIQNELLPRDWSNTLPHTDPTVISVWFEKEKGHDQPLIPPPWLPRRELLCRALTLDRPALREVALGDACCSSW